MTDFESTERSTSIPFNEENPELDPLVLKKMNSDDGVLENVDGYEEKTAGFWLRFWAFIMDSLIVTAIIGIVVNPIFYVMDWDLTGLSWYAPISIISAVIYYLYFVLMTYYLKQTVGKMVFGLRVVSLHHDKLSFGTVLFREWIGRVISNTIVPLYLLVIFLDKNQALHDYFADTKVIQENVYVKVKTKEIVPPSFSQNEETLPTTN